MRAREDRERERSFAKQAGGELHGFLKRRHCRQVGAPAKNVPERCADQRGGPARSAEDTEPPAASSCGGVQRERAAWLAITGRLGVQNALVPAQPPFRTVAYFWKVPLRL